MLENYLQAAFGEVNFILVVLVVVILATAVGLLIGLILKGRREKQFFETFDGEPHELILGIYGNDVGLSNLSTILRSMNIHVFGSAARALLVSKFEKHRRKVTFHIVSVDTLGLPPQSTTENVYKAIAQQGYKLCSPEVGAALLHQRSDTIANFFDTAADHQHGINLYMELMGTSPMTYILCIGYDNEGQLCLSQNLANATRPWRATDRFVVLTS
jgi:hypothetical protein